MLSFKLDKWQIKPLQILEKYSNVFLFVPRQNGKTQILVYYILKKCYKEDKKILFTSHRVDSCDDTFDKCIYEVLNNPLLNKLTKNFKRTSGSQVIKTKLGGSITFRTRSRRSGVGGTFDITVFDEAGFLTNSEMTAIAPTQATKKGQSIFCGTPPNSSLDGSYIKAARKKNYDKPYWIEYSLNKILQEENRTIQDVDIYNEKYLKATNPAYGTRITKRAVQREIAQLGSDEAYLTERLGYWKDEVAQQLYSPILWDSCRTNSKIVFDNPVIGVKISLGGEFVAVCVAQKKQDKIYIQAVDQQECKKGLDWVANFILNCDKIASIWADGIGVDIIANLIKHRYTKKVNFAKVKDIISMNQYFHQMMLEKKLQHYNQPALNQAVLQSKKNLVGKNGGWSAIKLYEDIDVSLHHAAALAVHGARFTTEKQQKLINF